MKFRFALLLMPALLLAGCSTVDLNQIAAVADTATRGTSMNSLVGIGTAAIPPNEQLLDAVTGRWERITQCSARGGYVEKNYIEIYRNGPGRISGKYYGQRNGMSATAIFAGKSAGDSIVVDTRQVTRHNSQYANIFGFDYAKLTTPNSMKINVGDTVGRLMHTQCAARDSTQQGNYVYYVRVDSFPAFVKFD